MFTQSFNTASLCRIDKKGKKWVSEELVYRGAAACLCPPPGEKNIM